MLRVEEVTRVDQLERYREAWRQLEERAERAELFTTYDWIDSWLRAFWPDRPLAFQFVWRGDRLEGLLPLVRDLAGLLWCRDSLVSPVNPHTTRLNVLTALPPDEILQAVLRHLRHTNPSIRLGVKHLAVDDPATDALLRLAPEEKLGTVVRQSHRSPIITLDDGWEAYQRSLTTHYRGEMRRRRRKIEQLGSAEYRLITTPDVVEPAMRDLIEIEKASWKYGAGTSWATQGEAVRFFLDLAKRRAGSGNLRLHILDLDGRPAAYQFGVAHRRTLYTLHTSYRDDARRLAAGTALTGYMVEDACAAGYTVVDLLGNNEQWKRPLATASRDHINVCMYGRNQIHCMWCRLLESRIKPAVRDKAPAVVEWKRRLRKDPSSRPASS